MEVAVEDWRGGWRGRWPWREGEGRGRRCRWINPGILDSVCCYDFLSSFFFFFLFHNMSINHLTEYLKMQEHFRVNFNKPCLSIEE